MFGLSSRYFHTERSPGPVRMQYTTKYRWGRVLCAEPPARYTEQYYHLALPSSIMLPQQTLPASRRRSLDVIGLWALVVTVAATLFVYLPSSVAPLGATKAFFLAAGTLVTLAIYILARLTRGNIILPSSALIGALWLPVVAYALSAAFSGTSFANALWGTALEQDTLGFMLIIACLGTLAALMPRRPEQYQAFFRVGAYAFGAVVLLSTLILLAGQVSPNLIAPSSSFFGSFADLAAFLGLGVIVILMTLRFVAVSDRTRSALVTIGAVALFLIAVANVSLVWILVALVSLGLFVESIMRRGPQGADADLDETVLVDEQPLDEGEGNHSLVFPLVVLAISLFFLIGGALGGALATSFHVNTLDVRPSWQSTLIVTEKTYAAAPFFGSGPNTFGAEWLKYRDASLNSTVFWNVDFPSGIGFIPTSAVTTGIVGIVAWVGFIVLFIVLGLRMLILRAPQEAFVRYVAMVSFVATLYLSLIATFDLPGPVILALLFVFAGVFVSSTRFAAQGRQWGVLFSRSPRLGFVIVFLLTILLLSSVVAAYATVERAVAASELAKALTAFSKGDLDAADRSAQAAVSFAQTSAAYQIQAGIANARINLIASSSTIERAAAQQAFQAALSSGINAALTATSLNPSDYQSWLMLGNLYAQAVPVGITGSYDSAKTAYEKARGLSPTNPQIPYILAQLDIANKDITAAKDELKAAIALKQDYTDAIFLLSQLEVRDGNVKEALDAALAAAYFAPRDPNVLFQVGILYAAQNDLPNAASALEAAIAERSQFANARYFLAAVYAKEGKLSDALAQMRAIAALSSANADAVASQLASLEAGKDPFPANLLSVTPAPVQH